MRTWKLTLALALWTLLLTGFSQAYEFAVVQDKDGYSNVRKAASSKGEVIAKIDHGAVVWQEEGAGKGDWQKVWFAGKGGEIKGGFIHKSRLAKLDQFSKVPAAKSGKDGISFKGKTIAAELGVTNFDRSKVSVTIVHYPDGNQQVIEIDRKPFFGTDGGLPKTRYSKIEITVGKKKISVPEEALADLFEPNTDPQFAQLHHDPKTGNIYLTTSNSDGAGGYHLAFWFVKGKYAGRVAIEL